MSLLLRSGRGAPIAQYQANSGCERAPFPDADALLQTDIVEFDMLHGVSSRVGSIVASMSAVLHGSYNAKREKYR